MNLNEAYIKAEKGNIYYTKNSDMFLSMVKSIFISNNKAVRVYYDINKGLYVFGDAFNYIHADLANGMKYHSNIYGPDEMRANVSYLRQNCALFQVLPDDDFKKYDVGDGYTDGWFLKIDDLIFACRNKQYHKLRDEVPLFKDYIGYWMPTDYYIAKKQGLTETVEDKITFEPTDESFSIGGKDFSEEDCDIYHICLVDKKIGMLAITKKSNGISIDGLELDKPYRQKGYGSKIVKMLKDKYGKIYVRSIPDAKGFWDKQGHKSSWNDDSGTFDGMLGESVQNDTDEKLNSKINCKIVLKDGKTIYGHLLSVNENYVYINSDNGNRIKKDNIKELYMYYDCEVITKNGKTIYGNFVGDFGDHKLHLDDSFNRKGWAIKDELIDKVNYKRVLKKELNEGILGAIAGGLIGKKYKHPYIGAYIGHKIQDKFFNSKNKKDNKEENKEDKTDYKKIIYNEIFNDLKNKKITIDTAIDMLIDNKIAKDYDNAIDIVDFWCYKYGLNKSLNESVEDKILYIIRGVPGSGKSTLAHKLTDNVVEADQYFYDDEGNYNWSADKLNQAHNWCYNTVKKYMEEGRDKIAVANTFVKKRDYKRYVELAEQFGYKVDIRVCNGNFKNIHGVPDETVERMRAKFQLDESIQPINTENIPTKFTSSVYEMKNYIENHKNLRIVYDTENKWYFFNNSDEEVHAQILDDAISAGYYPNETADGDEILFGGNDGEFITLLIENVMNIADAELDGYAYGYVYDDFIIYDRYGDYRNMKLCKALGKPNKILDLEDEIYGKEELDESALNDKVFYTKQLSNMLNICLNIGNARFIYIPEANLYVIGDAHNNTHISLFISALDEGKFDIGENDIDEYFDEYINSAEDTGAIITKEYANDKNIWLKSPDSTNVINDYGKFYLCNGLCIEDSLTELTNIKPKYVKRISYLDESAENDRTLRDYAVKLANICLDALVKTKYETKISKEQVQINVDKAFKKAVPMLKNSPYEYFIILVSKNDELYASYGKTADRKYGLITLPVFSKDPIDQTLSILHKHKSILNKLYSTYSGDELKLKINEYAIKYLKKELEKSLSNVKSEYIDILIHECTHLLDDVRRTKTYNKSKEQNLKDDKGIETYYNSPEEQNAYYQETVSIFDEYAENKLVGYKTFDIFWDDFIRQYRGEYNMLNDKNKRKLKKRAYTYWYVYMKD